MILVTRHVNTWLWGMGNCIILLVGTMPGQGLFAAGPPTMAT